MKTKKRLVALASMLVLTAAAAFGYATKANATAVTPEAHSYNLQSKDNATVVFDKAGDATISWICSAKDHDDGQDFKKSLTEELPGGPFVVKFSTGKINKTLVKAGSCAQDEIYEYSIKLTDIEGRSQTYTQQVVTKEKALFAHDFSDVSVWEITSPTCDDPGQVVEVCKICGAKKDPVVSGAVGHEFKVEFKNLKNVTLNKSDFTQDNVAESAAVFGEKVLEDTVAILIDRNYHVDNNKNGGYYDIVVTCQHPFHLDTCTYTRRVYVPLPTEVRTEYHYVNMEVQVGENTGRMTLNTAWGAQDKKNNVVIESASGKVLPINCDLEVTYKEVTIDDYDAEGIVTSVKTVSRKIPHQWSYSAPENKWSKNVKVTGVYDKFVATNSSCAVEGSYEVWRKCDVCGKYELFEKRTVPKSPFHQEIIKTDAHGEIAYENDTATCTKDGTREIVYICKVCGIELRRETVKSPAKGHIYLDPVKENVVPATAHKNGSYDSVVYCGRCGAELSRVPVILPAFGKGYNWKFYLVWQGYFNQNLKEQTGYLDVWEVSTQTPWAYDDIPDAAVIAVPTDSDLTETEKELLSQVVTFATVTEDLEKRVPGTVEELGQRTFVATSKGTSTELTNVDGTPTKWDLKDTQTYVTRSWDYKGKAADAEKAEEKPIDEPKEEVKKIDISTAVIADGTGRAPYRGEYQPIPYTLTVDGKALKENVDFVVTNAKKNVYKGVGWHGLEVEGIGEYSGNAQFKLWIDQATNNKVKVSVSKKTFKASNLKKKAASFQVKVTKTKADAGSLKAASSNKKYVTVKKVEAGTYKITVKKGTPKDTYTVTFTAKENKYYTAAKKSVKITVK